MIGYYSYLRRQPNFRHAAGVKLAMMVPHKFVPTPGVPDQDIAFKRGAEAKLLGLPQTENKYPPDSPLAAEWNRGYASKTDPAERREV